MTDTELSNKLVNLDFKTDRTNIHQVFLTESLTQRVLSKILALGFLDSVAEQPHPANIFHNLTDSQAANKILALGFLDNIQVPTSVFDDKNDSAVVDKLIELGFHAGDHDLNITEEHPYFGWISSGEQNQFRTTSIFHEDSSDHPIRSVRFVGDQLEVELATFSPSFSGSTEMLMWDEPATNFTISVSNPDDFPSKYISSVHSLINASAGFHSTLRDFVEGSPSALPDGESIGLKHLQLMIQQTYILFLRHYPVGRQKRQLHSKKITETCGKRIYQELNSIGVTLICWRQLIR